MFRRPRLRRRTLGKGIIERDIEVSVPDKSTEIILYYGGGYRSAPSPTLCKTWATLTSSQWQAAGRPENKRTRQSKATGKTFDIGQLTFLCYYPTFEQWIKPRVHD